MAFQGWAGLPYRYSHHKNQLGYWLVPYNSE